MNNPVIILRHAMTADSLRFPQRQPSPDDRLNDCANHQIEDLIRRLKCIYPDKSFRILTSSLRRAQETGEFISEIGGYPFVGCDPLFDEWRAPRIVWHKSPRSYPPYYRLWKLLRFLFPRWKLYQGESVSQFNRRTWRGKERILSLKQDGPYLIVSHQMYIGGITFSSHIAPTNRRLFYFAKEFKIKNLDWIEL